MGRSSIRLPYPLAPRHEVRVQCASVIVRLGQSGIVRRSEARAALAGLSAAFFVISLPSATKEAKEGSGDEQFAGLLTSRQSVGARGD